MTTAQIDFGRFEPISQAPTYRLIYRSWGWDKVGKNHFGYSMPGPILGLYLDPGGTEGVAQKFLAQGKDIRQIQYRFNKKRNTQDDAKRIRDQWLEDYGAALESARSIQLDESELWEMFRFAQWGKEISASPGGRDFGPLNALYRGLIQDAFDAGVNLQLIQKVKEKWIDDKPSGKMTPLGFPQAGNIVQVSLEHSWTKEGGFRVRIVNARQNTAVWGEEFSNLTFPELGTLIYPESQESDWQ